MRVSPYSLDQFKAASLVPYIDIFSPPHFPSSPGSISSSGNLTYTGRSAFASKYALDTSVYMRVVSLLLLLSSMLSISLRHSLGGVAA